MGGRNGRADAAARREGARQFHPARSAGGHQIVEDRVGGGFVVDAGVVFAGGMVDLFAVVGQQRLVGGDDRLALPQCLQRKGARNAGSADKLDDQLAGDPPADNTYTLKEITIDLAPVTTGRVYFGRLVRGSDKFYFRLLVKKGDQGFLVQGSGIDRFLEFQASFQDRANNPIAKH